MCVKIKVFLGTDKQLNIGKEAVQMDYFPILQDLLKLHTIVFLLIGVVWALVAGKVLKTVKTSMIAVASGFLIYVVCEALVHIPHGAFADFLAVFIGTIALGTIPGYLVWMVIRLRNNKGIAGHA